jgi:hypothetical protein
MLRKEVGVPVLFVCGNHCYWGGSIVKVRKSFETDNLAAEGIIWMGGVDFVPFGTSTAIVGHDGWYDGYHGNARGSRFVMNDWFKIDEFSIKLDMQHIIDVSRHLAMEGAERIRKGCVAAISAGRRRIIIMTHFPPFVDVCLYRGRLSDLHALPWYTSKLMGDTLLDLAGSYPDVSFTVLCGHTHSKAEKQISSNLRVFVGGAEYGAPRHSTVGVEE